MNKIIVIVLGCLIYSVIGQAQVKESMYGDAVKADIKMKYVYSFEEALRKAKEEHKLIFFNCFADWAIPCHAMNKAVFSNQEFADWMDRHFVNFFIDVTSPEGKPLGEKYNITFQAHYLVLNSDGDIVHRIVGGCEIPEFKEKLLLALNPKTSLAGMTQRYDNGERGMKFLRDYAWILRTADNQERYEQVVNLYFSKCKKSDWSKQENWDLFRDRITKPEGEMYDYLISHKSEFVKTIGASKVDLVIIRLYLSPLFSMATGSKPYDGKEMLNISLALQKADIPKDHDIYTFYELAKYREEENFDKVLELFEQKVPAMDERSASGLDFSLKSLTKLSKQQKERAVKYLTARSEKVEGSSLKEYQSIIKEIINPEGIRFTGLTFDKALAKAASEGKLLFIDCYTSWCGPCRMMSKEVFTQKSIGDFFNEHFVNLKVDMEKGEGISLQKRYNVNAFPTMMLLDGKGRIVYKILGGQDPKAFMEKVLRGLLPEACYYQLKENYDAGDRSVALMPEYLLTLGDAGELENQAEEIQNYLKTLKGVSVFDKSTWKLYDYSATNFKMPEFQFLCENRKQFAEQVGEDKVNHKIEEVIFPAVINYLKKVSPKEEMELVRKLIMKANLPENSSVSYLDRIATLYEQKEFGKMMDFYENKVIGLTDAKMRLNLDVLLKSLLQDASMAEKERAVGYIQKCLKNADSRAVNTYNGLLEILSKQG